MKVSWLVGTLLMGLLAAGCGNQPSLTNNSAAYQPVTETEPRPATAEVGSNTDSDAPVSDLLPEAISPTPTQARATPEPTNTPRPQATPTVEVNWLKVSGKTAEGLAYLGNPDAPVTLTDYADFM